jgi:hypothetical protein
MANFSSNLKNNKINTKNKRGRFKNFELEK